MILLSRPSENHLEMEVKSFIQNNFKSGEESLWVRTEVRWRDYLRDLNHNRVTFKPIFKKLYAEVHKGRIK